jgi:Tfp pilus assembly protein PilP
MRSRLALLACALLAACGGDDDAPPPGPRPPGAPGGNAASPTSNGSMLQPRLHVEDMVACPTPVKPSGPDCKPEAPTCDPGLYCLLTGEKGAGGYHCEPCPDRERIRYEFKDRDFFTEQARDPFQSFVIVQSGLAKPTENKTDPDRCKQKDQLVATNSSYEDMKLVGIVAQGTQRKALMMDSGNLGHIVKRNDCVGKEKALVKDIGTNIVTFEIAPQGDDKVKRPPIERSVPLYPNGLQPAMPTSQPPPVDEGPAAPVVAPPVAPPPPSAGPIRSKPHP